MKSIFNTISAFVVALIFSLASLLLPLATSASPYFPYGEGTEEDPYKIGNCNHLQAIENDLDAYYELLVNIDCSDNEFTHIGDNDTPFTGSLEGNNKIIKNLNVDDFGLFGRIDKGQVTNLKLINPTVSGTTYVGSLAGTVNGEGALITNVHVENGTVNATSNYIGGLIGGAAIFNLTGLNNPVIEKNSYRGTVSSPGVMGGFIGTANGAAYVYNNYAITTLTLLPEDSPTVGGFFGINSSNQTSNNYAIATIDADNGGFNSTVGGFVGIASGTQNYSFADMDYNSGASQVGDFMGFSAGSSINGNYYADHGHGFSSNSANPGAQGAQSVDVTANPDYFKTESNAPLDFWDFETTWQITEGEYPSLIGEAVFGDISGDMNGDNIDDSYQATVIGVPDDNQNLTVVELNSDTDCTLDPVGSWIDAGYYKEDPYYPLQIPRMTGFKVYCPNPGSQVLVTLIYPEEYDTSDSVLRFYNDVTDEYHNVSDVTFGTREVGGNTVTTATYMLVDGSINDTDGQINGVIQDPVGIAVNNEPAQSNSSGTSSSSSSNSSNSGLASTGESTNLPLLLASMFIIISLLSLPILKNN